MSRQARIHGYSRIYHVMLQGINHQQIFLDNNDNIQFLKILYELIPISNFNLIAYCLMGNHVHLLIQEQEEPLELIMKRLEIRYVKWYNNKYNRSGHLFTNRYKSEPVDDERYFLTVYRYILQNPLKAGLCSDLFSYSWSSAASIFNSTDSVISTKLIKSYFHSKSELLIFLNSPSDEENILEESALDINTTLPDQKLIGDILTMSHCSNIAEFQRLDISIRNETLKTLCATSSIRQLARITGLSKSQIQRIISKNN